jgi:hypothetical protein
LSKSILHIERGVSLLTLGLEHARQRYHKSHTQVFCVDNAAEIWTLRNLRNEREIYLSYFFFPAGLLLGEDEACSTCSSWAAFARGHFS